MDRNIEEICLKENDFKTIGTKIMWLKEFYNSWDEYVHTHEKTTFIGEHKRFIKIFGRSCSKDTFRRYINVTFSSRGIEIKTKKILNFITSLSEFSGIPVHIFIDENITKMEFKSIFDECWDKVNNESSKKENLFNFPYLQNTLKDVSLLKLKKDFKMLKGHYNSFIYFDGNEGKISVTHAEIYDIDTKNMVLKCKFPSLYGDYEGCVIKAKNKLFLLIESLEPKDESLKGIYFYPEVLSIILRYPDYWPTDSNNFLLYGNFLALSEYARPCSSRIIWKKISDESKLIKNGQYFKDEIKDVHNFEKIEKWVRNNRVDWKRGLVCDEPDSGENFIDDINIISYIKDRLNLDLKESSQLWKVLQEKVFFREYRYGFNRTIELCGIDKDGYQNIRIITDYELRNTDRKDLKFACNLEGVTSEVVNEKEYEISWIFVPTDNNIDKLPDKCFCVDYVNIDGKEFIPEQHPTKSEKRVEFIVKTNLKSIQKIHYVFTVKQAAKYCFVSDYITKITNDYKVILDIRDKNIENVFPKEFFLLSGKHRNPNPKNSDLKKFTVCGDGWIFPRSGVSFSWSMK